MMMEQLYENSLACPFPAYQVIVWHYKFQPGHQVQFLPLTRGLKVIRCSTGSGRNTFAHTCALFIYNRCRVEGPAQNGCHLSNINNSAPQAQIQREVRTGKSHTLPHWIVWSSTSPGGERSHSAFILYFRQLLLFMALWLWEGHEERQLHRAQGRR